MAGAATIDGTIAIGYQALTALTSGAGNVAVGYQAADALTSGKLNTAVGHQSLSASEDGDRNTALGYQAMLIYEGGSTVGENTCVGYKAGAELTIGSQNVFIGSETNGHAVSASNQVVIGYGADGQANNSVVLGNASVGDIYMSQDAQATVRCGNVHFDAQASGNANTLDDYEEGTYDPIIGSVGEGNMTTTGGVDATYTRIGNFCHVNGSLSRTTSETNWNGQNAYITLPFASKDDAGGKGGVLTKRSSSSQSGYHGNFYNGGDIGYFLMVQGSAPDTVGSYLRINDEIANDDAIDFAFFYVIE